MGTILLYWSLLITLFATYIKQGLQNTIALSSTKETVLENSSVALTCYNKTGLLSESRWYTSMQKEVAVCTLVGNECKKTRFLNNNDLMDCSCNDNGTYTVTINHVDRYQHESRWRCGFPDTDSNTVVIKVSVPVTHAILNHSQIDPLYENRSVAFTCTSSYSLPSAMIRWYRSYSSSIVEITDSRDDVKIKREPHTVDNVTRVIETLSYMVNRSVNGWGVYCTASNWQSNVVTSDKIELSVVYPPDKPPVIDGFSNGSTYKVTENEKANLSCSVKGGNPLAKPQWHCERIDNTTSNKRITKNGTVTSYLSWLTKRTDGKTCICHTGHVLSNVSIYIIIDVLYRASVKKFVVNGYKKDVRIEAKESTNITFTCEVDSNPNSTVSVTTPNRTVITSTGTNVFEFSHFLSSCVDNGTYICSGSNDYNNGQPGFYDLPVFVNCTPMAFSNIETDIRGKLYYPVTIQFRTIAYPEPEFIWEKLTNGFWKELTNDNMFFISSHKLQSNLTVFNFTSTTEDLYRLVVRNEIGTLIQNYSLKPFDRPGRPTEFRHIIELLTDTSVTLEWKPGFNGGIQQTFFIMYREENDKDWKNMSVHDTGDIIMDVTVHGLSSDTSYLINIFAMNSEGKSEIATVDIKTKEMAREDVTKPESKAGLIIGCVSGVVFVTLGAVFGILVYRKRFSSSGKENESSKLVYQNVPFAGKSPDKKLNAKVTSKKETSFQELDDAPPIYKEPTEYNNPPDKIEHIERIQVSELLPFVLGSSEESFAIEYQKLPTDLQKPCVFARKPENIALNRYNGIYPYDHSRVKISGQPDFFINACYIDGFAKQNEYIASLGPTGKATYAFKTFWMMVWNERSDIIVMLTNLREPSGMKCEQYWPELGTTSMYGDIQVTFDKEDAFAEYTTRSFIVSKAKEKRTVTHLHYTAWPDKKVPEDVTTLIEFRQSLKMTPSVKKGPLIVHCSAGIGRTGTLIALDRLIQEGQRESSVDVFKCVNSMREQRVKMVQTLEQYIYIYKALVNSLYFDSEVVPIESFQEYVDQTNNNIYSRQFQQLKDSVEKSGKEEYDARARNKLLVDKNQNDADIPGNQYRVYLYQNRSMDNSDYINAVYVSSFKKKDHFILAQSPLPGAVSDFVCMMYQENCCCVVTMEDLNKPGMSVGHYLPTDGQSQKFGDIKISCRILETKPQYTVREIKMQNSGKFESRGKVTYHFQYNKWLPGNDTPADTKGFVQFIQNVEDYADQLGGEGSHVLVHCLKANERSALYSIVTILIEKIRYERQVSVLNTVRHLRTRRRTAITSMEQLKFCYKALQAYIDMFQS